MKTENCPPINHYILHNDVDYDCAQLVYCPVDPSVWPNFEALAVARGWIVEIRIAGGDMSEHTFKALRLTWPVNVLTRDSDCTFIGPDRPYAASRNFPGVPGCPGVPAFYQTVACDLQHWAKAAAEHASPPEALALHEGWERSAGKYWGLIEQFADPLLRRGMDVRVTKTNRNQNDKTNL